MLIIEELYRLAEAFAANRLEYAVCGGLAMAIHGRPRLTVDIDVSMTSPIERADRGKRQSRGWSDEMDSRAIARRLAIVEELYATWLALKDARKIRSPSVAADVMPAKPPSVPDSQS